MQRYIILRAQQACALAAAGRNKPFFVSLPAIYRYGMGRNKFSEKEIKEIGRLLRLKNAGNRYKQKLLRHELRVNYEFNISDFNVPGQAFGEEDLQRAIRRGAIEILDDATIEAMKQKRARDKQADYALIHQQAIASGDETDWKEALKQWELQSGGEGDNQTGT